MTDDMLCRSAPFELRDGTDEGDGLTLAGYAAVFNSPTRIDSWEGVFDEEIAPGAFKRSLAERTPVLQFDHGKHSLVGSIPLGSFESITEDERGLPIVARLHDNWLVQPVRDAVKSKAIPGMSFRFSVRDDEWRTAKGEPIPRGQVDAHLARSNRADPNSVPKRTLRDVDLYELGPVVFPAYTDTTVGVRSREFIALLQDPQVRAEAAALLVGTKPESNDAGASDAERAATDEASQERPESTNPIPSPAARKRDLIEIGVLSDG